VPRNGVLLVALAATAFALAGCGGGGSKSPSASVDPQSQRFEQRGFEITFHYPAELKQSKLLLGSSVGTESGRAGFGIDKDNVIMVSRYDLRRPVTADGLAGVKLEVDGVITQLAGREVPGRRVLYGGLPGYAYRVPLGSPQGAVSRLFVLFDNAVEYFFNCQSTPESRYEIDQACDEALTTIEKLRDPGKL
jgi:hypothetical protein